MRPWQAAVKRSFDILVSGTGLIVLGWLIFICYLAASVDCRASGFFLQQRIGRFGRPFSVIKLRTMRDHSNISTTVTSADDPRITSLGRFFRRYKLDELPQLINVFFGQMSLVGPRPDVPGFADQLEGDDRIMLNVRPGITGPATLRFRDEEELLLGVENAEQYNREVIFPEKVRLNREYIENYSLRDDLRYIFVTLFGSR
jgi:lipopolysaccharide/colanic/teichoic acid biosynthesis glycosyltransferase